MDTIWISFSTIVVLLAVVLAVVSAVVLVVFGLSKAAVVAALEYYLQNSLIVLSLIIWGLQ